MTTRANSTLILGGAGFLGSNTAKAFVKAGHQVTIIDGLLPKTGGRRANLSAFSGQVRFIDRRIEDVTALRDLVRSSSTVIDAMAWTSHRLALHEPVYDLELNARAHLMLIQALKPESFGAGQTKSSGASPRVIYLGSRSQYGAPQVPVITENTPFEPEDVQGIHKTAAESYYRIYSKLYGFTAVSLRLPNCFGENQPLSGEDIGLVGGFIRDLLGNKEIEVYGGQRRRTLVYAADLADVVLKLSEHPLHEGFHPFNLAGHDVSIGQLVTALIDLVGKGEWTDKPMPEEVQRIDIGNAAFSDAKLATLLGQIPRTLLQSALFETIRYFKAATG